MRTASVPLDITTADSAITSQRARVSIGSLSGRGRRCMTSSDVESTPKLMAGGPSMIMFTHKIAIGVNGFPSAMPRIELTRNETENPRVVLSWKRTNFTMLS